MPELWTHKRTAEAVWLGLPGMVIVGALRERGQRGGTFKGKSYGEHIGTAFKWKKYVEDIGTTSAGVMSINRCGPCVQV